MDGSRGSKGSSRGGWSIELRNNARANGCGLQVQVPLCILFGAFFCRMGSPVVVCRQPGGVPVAALGPAVHVLEFASAPAGQGALGASSERHLQMNASTESTVVVYSQNNHYEYRSG
jgi:hypothetical protein